MKKLLSIVVALVLAMSMLPLTFAVSTGGSVTPIIITEDFAPLVWMCDNRIVYDDNTEPGRQTGPGDELEERMHNYAFEGEQVEWEVLVMDKNGVEKIQDVFATIGDAQGAGNDIEVNCDLAGTVTDPYDECHAVIGEEQVTTFDDDVMEVYTCTLTVETSDSMYGEYWVTVEAIDMDGLSGTMAENEYWYLNPIVALSIDGAMEFDNVRPGADAYSETMLVGNDADEGSGVMLDMFISGTDFYDSSSSGAMCPTTNQLELSNFRYFATSGAYSTQGLLRTTSGTSSDTEGYLDIPYGTGFNVPNPFYGSAEIIPTAADNADDYSNGNVLSPGAEIAMTFRLSLPLPCNGDFDSGAIYFWGEAV